MTPSFPTRLPSVLACPRFLQIALDGYASFRRVSNHVRPPGRRRVVADPKGGERERIILPAANAEAQDVVADVGSPSHANCPLPELSLRSEEHTSELQ